MCWINFCRLDLETKHFDSKITFPFRDALESEVGAFFILRKYALICQVREMVK